MEEMNFRTALKIGYFDLQRHLRWYTKRCLGNINSALLKEFIINQTKILTPITPHICEEIWEKLGNEGFITMAEYPITNKKKINSQMEASEEFLLNTISDIREILKVTGIKANKIVLYTSPDWKYKMHGIAVEMALSNTLNMSELMKKAMSDEDIKKSSKEASAYAKKLGEELRNRGRDELEKLKMTLHENDYLNEAKDFLMHEFKCEVEVYSFDDKERYDPKGKARFAVPFRPAIFVE
jgi:leucyl-tRNA synthetase